MRRISNEHEEALRPPALVDVDSNGLLAVQPLVRSTLSANQSCLLTHFTCPEPDYYCLPVFLRCNGVADCPGHEDEKDCREYTCPGFYRCRGSRVCVHADHLCDGYEHCPENDDEWLCGFQCPSVCRCYGMAFYCQQAFLPGKHPQLRYVNADKSRMTLKAFEGNTMLTYLSLVSCSLHDLRVSPFPNLLTHNYADNPLTQLGHESFKNVTNLRVLSLAGNSMAYDVSASAFASLTSLRVLDLSKVHMRHVNVSTLQHLTSLLILNLSHTGLDGVTGTGFQPLPSLHTVDLRGCPMRHFPESIFQNITNLQSIVADNYKLCCGSVLPIGFNPKLCMAPPDTVSSCEDLLGNKAYRAALWPFAVLSMLGNITCFVYRVVFNKEDRGFSLGVFMIHLYISDFVRGLYMMVIVLADHSYRGRYLWADIGWRHSATCQAAGVLSLMSLKMSLFLIFLVMVDRVLHLHVPCRPLGFTPRSAHVVSGLVWTGAFTLGCLPLFPSTSHWQLYGRTGLCAALPLSEDRTAAGYDFALGVFYYFNLPLVLLAIAAQGFVSWSVSATIILQSVSSVKTHALIMARRVLSVALSDCVCWLAVGVLGLLAARDIPVPREATTILGVLVFPFSAALHPFFYMLSLNLEHMRTVREKRLLTILSRQQAHKVM